MKNLLPFLLITALLINACGKKEDCTEETVFNLEEAYIHVSESKDHINIRVESLLDSIDHRTEEFPLLDFCNIAFDVNGNGQIDENIDFGFSSPSNNYDICSFYFLDTLRITGCGVFESEADFDHDFASSDISSTAHPIWNLSIPKKDFGNNRTLNFVVKTYEPGRYLTYPVPRVADNSGAINFDRTFEVIW